MIAETKRNKLPYSYRKKGRCFGKYIIAPTEHQTSRMIKRKYSTQYFFGWRLKAKRDFKKRSKLLKQYFYVNFYSSTRS